MSIRQSPISKGDILKTLTGSGVLTDLAEGSAALVTVDHSAEFTFGMCPMPEFVTPAGVRVVVLCEATDGAGFVVEVENISYTTDLGCGSGGPDVPYSWVRRGTL